MLTRCHTIGLVAGLARKLDGTFRSMFERWHPGLANDNPINTLAAA